MSIKYTSMQEELAARRAAGEKREPAADRNDLESSGHFERTSEIVKYKGQRRRPGSNRNTGSYSRSRQGSPTDPKVRLALTDHFSQQKRPGPGGWMFSSMRRSVMTFIFLVVGVAVITAAVAAFMHSKEAQPAPTDPTEITEMKGMTGSSQAGGTTETKAGGINEHSSLTDIYAYSEAKTEPMKDPQSLYGETYWSIKDIINEYEKDCSWYIKEGRIYVSPLCLDTDDPEELTQTWGRATERIHEKIEADGKNDAPVIVTVHTKEKWRLMLLLIDGRTEFLSQSWVQ